MSGKSGAKALRVLVVDDDPGTTVALHEFLSDAGHNVRVAKGGEEALVTAASFAPHVLLVDLGLPDVDGFALAKRLRQLPETADARLIAITGYRRGASHAAVLAGFEACLVKPLDLSILLATLARSTADTS